MTKTVLIIEDDPSNLLVLKGHLRQAGYRTLEATDGQTGLDLARGGGIDLITLDLRMAPLDGWAVHRALRDDPVLRAIPVLLITIVDQSPRQLGLEVAGYLAKPFRRQDLLQCIEHALIAAAALN